MPNDHYNNSGLKACHTIKRELPLHPIDSHHFAYIYPKSTK